MVRPLALRVLFKRHLNIAVFSAALVCGATTAAYAGFEWVPAPKAAMAVKKDVPVLMPAVPVPMASVEKMAAPVVSSMMHMDNDSDMLPLPVMQEAPVMMNDTNPPPKKMSPMPVSTSPAMDTQVAPESAMIKQRVVVSDNAPKSAVQKMRDGGLKIQAYPEINKDSMLAMEKNGVLAQTAPLPLLQEAEMSQDSVVGFATDMPLALALRQVVPAQYSYYFSERVNPGYRVSWSGGKAWMDVVQDMVAPLNLVAELRGNTVHIRFSNQAALQMDGGAESAVMASNIETASGDAQASMDVSLMPMGAAADRTNVIDPGEMSAMQPSGTVEALEDVVRERRVEGVAVADATTFGSSGTLFWEARRGDSLKDTLDHWSKISGFELVWEAGYDYRLKSDVFAAGRFENALEVVLSVALEGENAPALLFVKSDENEDQPVKLIIRDQPVG